MPSSQESTPLVNADARSAGLNSLAERRALVALLLAIVGVLGFALVDVSVPLDLAAAGEPRYLCDPASRQDAGYVKLANKVDDHYFYWYFQSRRSPATDPLVLWLTGGPGGSSVMAMLAENGPCKILPGAATETNPYSWTTHANVVWLDQPTSVGFSYGEKQDEDFNETDVGENIFWFLKGFLAKHPELEGREFFITGESYGGHYVPVAAHYLWRRNRLTPGAVKLNLQGIAVGNGLTDPIIQYPYNADMANNTYNISLLTPAQTLQMRTDAVECVDLTRECQLDHSNRTLCSDAQGCWKQKLIAPFKAAQRNRYDIRQPCHPDFPLCYNFSDIHAYLDSSQVREMLHVDPSLGPWLEINNNVFETFVTDGDWSMSFDGYVADLLDAGLRVLIYAGDADIMCNWVGNRAWPLALDWKDRDGFNAAEERAFVARDPLLPDGASHIDAGVVRAFRNFAFIRVFDAGHMVPMDQPAVALDLLDRFLANRAF